ncbi:hypothetical protein [Brevibacillus laterosporus]|uniref:Uncharacterized protein n=1 Tax=Brevibacillus laterosporus TaxID=1465 RepID=A0AAP3DCF2_BRELA|nr:hypothetical protein [Brevibacillus laterosporus]MCR8978663.1 hypothetical protein [Brevibacillus laterosporus]MCZ0805819.1 hypothetical protein [Brevibacillus laterosporus]MCZ0824415.1 hypothetical protein [Brevibacillus laterosporus]MCZ0848319.1 hypothetical protein [Brevibacillus laterosporus]
MFKKILMMFTFLALFATTIIAPSPNAFAFADQTKSVSVAAEGDFTKEDILPLKKYVLVNNEGFFEFDIEKAKADGFEEELLIGQQKYLQQLNTQIAEGDLKAYNNLDVKAIHSNKPSSVISIKGKGNCNGITTEKTTYWWGYSRKLDSCEANKVAADFAGAASVAGGVAIVAGIWGVAPAVPPGIAGSYWALLSSRIYANNSDNTGVVLDMTWAYIFDIEPQ